MVDVTLEQDEWYPAYFYDRRWKSGIAVVRMTNAEFVQMVMLHERWQRMQSDLAERTGYWK